MTEGFKIPPGECSHERLTRAEDTTVSEKYPHYMVWCADCGQNQMDLPIFLRACADDDEKWVRRAIAHIESVWGEHDAQAFITGHDLYVFPGRPGTHLTVPPGRMDRETKALRALVDEYVDLLMIPGEPFDDRTEQRMTLRFALEHLGTGYRDHKDYRPEWAPYEED